METAQITPFAAIAEFDTPGALVQAAEKVRKAGYSKTDALTPFPVHGIDEALGIPRSHLGYIVLCIGMMGTAAALLLQWWTGAVDYPLVIGGKPLFAFEFSIPVTFELTVLFSSFAAVFGMLALNGLPRFYHPLDNARMTRRVSDDRFVLVIDKSDPKFHPVETIGFLRSLNPISTELVED
ncbi:MAG: DUF3341 domain-containing protein [Acidobacteria bacterium]|nr:DUF3341 domain-containing protein [Acidobacteriota bacterium]